MFGKCLRVLAAACLIGLVACAAPTSTTPSRQTAKVPGALFGPYVNHVDATSARVLWVAPADAPVQPMVLRLSPAAVLTVEPTATAITGRDELLWTAEAKELLPGTRYEYTVGVGKGAAAGSFMTAPQSAVPFRFVAYGDTRTQPERHKSVADAIAGEDPALVLCSGDLVADGRVWELWQREFFDPAAAYLRNAALWPTRGNHEQDAVLMRDLLDLPGNELYFSFDFANAHFIVLDNYADDRAAMLQWLEEDLAANDAEWTFVCYHEPTFNVGGHASKWGRTDFLPVLEAGGVDFVLTGHSHLYERFLPIGPAGGKPVMHVMTGGGGAPSYPAKPSPVLAGGIGVAELHYCVFDVDGDTLVMTVKRPDGSVIDELTLVKTDGAYQDEVMAQAVDTQTAIDTALVFAELSAELMARADGTAQVLLHLPALPEGTALAAEATGDAWDAHAAGLVVADGRASFPVRAPQGFLVGLDGIEPPLRLALSVGEGEHAVHVDDVEVRASDETLRELMPAPQAVEVRRLAGVVRVDGDVRDWADTLPTPMPFHSGRAGSVRLGWNEDGLYGLALVRDADVAVNLAEPWRGDTLELFIEKDAARASDMHANAAQIVMCPLPDAGPGPAHFTAGHGDHWSSEEGAVCAWARASDGYVLEFAVPAQYLGPAAMEAGTVIGLNFALSNGGRAVQQFYSDKGSHEGWHRPITWGVVRLVE